MFPVISAVSLNCTFLCPSNRVSTVPQFRVSTSASPIQSHSSRSLCWRPTFPPDSNFSTRFQQIRRRNQFIKFFSSCHLHLFFTHFDFHIGGSSASGTHLGLKSEKYQTLGRLLEKGLSFHILRLLSFICFAKTLRFMF